MLALAESPRATWAMGAVAFAESSFFPIPPDIMLVPMSVARPDKALFYAAVCTVASVLGGILGYAIGALLYDSVGRWIVETFAGAHGIESFRAFYAEWGSWMIIVKGLTPIPYKIVTILSGFSGYNFFWFVVLSALTRGARFFILAGILNYFGEPIRAFIERRLGLVAVMFLAVVVGGVLATRYLF
jgi:membrane protein YqaA with SNARE-associated domain